MYNVLRLTQCRTHLILEAPALGILEHPLIDDAESQHMIVCRGEITRQRRDTRQRTRLRLHLTVGIGARHTLLQRTVLSCDGQGRIELHEDFRVLICIAQ